MKVAIPQQTTNMTRVYTNLAKVLLTPKMRRYKHKMDPLTEVTMDA